MSHPSDSEGGANRPPTDDDALEEYVPYPYQSLDANGTILRVNDAWLDVLEYERGAVEGRPFADFLEADTEDAFAEQFAEFKSAGTVSDVEMVLERGDGEEIVVAYEGTIEYDEEGSFVRTHCQFSEVTAERERRDELEQINTVLSTLMENLPFGVLIEDADREIIGVNDAFGDVFELPFPAEELLGEDCGAQAEGIKDVFADPDAFIEGIEDRLEKRERVIGEELRLADGRVLERSYIPYTLPGGKANFWIYRDVSDRAEREAVLQSLHRSTRDLLEAEDPDDLAERTLQAAKNTLGYPITVVRLLSADGETLEPVAITDGAREILGERPTYRVGEGTAGAAFERNEPLVIEDLEEWTDEYDRKDGRSAMYLPIGDYGVLGIGDVAADAFDDSDVKLASILATNAEAALERMDRERELRRQNERLEEFASIVSHDLRNPMSVASGHLEIARDERDSEHLEAVETALERMESIIDDTLTLASEGKTVGETEPVDIEDVVRKSWRMVETDEATLTLEEPFVVQGDVDRLHHFFENLFRNSVEHGGPDVTITIGPIDSTGFYVEDDGPGISPEDREDVFEPGQSWSEDGTGFGLAIVRRIAEAHGWDVRIRTGDRGGARFEITGVEIE